MINEKIDVVIASSFLIDISPHKMDKRWKLNNFKNKQIKEDATNWLMAKQRFSGNRRTPNFNDDRKENLFDVA